MRIIGHIMRQSNSQIQNKLNSGITMSITEIILSRKNLNMLRVNNKIVNKPYNGFNVFDRRK